MREPLPQPDHQPYDRPQQPWVCGRASEGDPCAFGPNHKGACPALAECQPVEVDGRWECNRAASRGGPCDVPSSKFGTACEGPSNDGVCCREFRCRPVRNLRSLRGALTRSAFLFAIGAVLMLLGSNWRNEAFVPGPLCSHHSQVLRGEGWGNRCASCHAAGDQSAASWFSAAVGVGVDPTQSEKCMACHDNTISQEFALAAHNMPAEKLAALRATVDLSNNNDNDNHSRNLACSVCHQEHRGADHAIAAMDNARCQSCHERQFESFATDHPELGIWPYERRTPISFSHTTHSGKHFVEKNLEFDCSRCHLEDATRNIQTTLSYDVTCAECHDEDIATSTAEGVALFALPSVDLDALVDAGIEVGTWPDLATGDFDGALPPMMKLLLSADPEAKKAIELFGADFEFYDIDPDNPEHLKAAADLTHAIKQLLAHPEPVAGPLQSLIRRGGRAGAPPPNLVKTAHQKWFSPYRDPKNVHEANDAPRHPGTWFIQETNLSIRYQPTGHADPVLRAWIDAAAATEETALRDTILTELAGPNAPGRCGTCHTVDEQPDGTLKVHWHPHDRRHNPRGFTRFSHAPHLLQVELRDCTACHQIDPQADTSRNTTSRNPTVRVSDFKPMSKAACASCHTKSVVSDSCTQCHNYHVE